MTIRIEPAALPAAAPECPECRARREGFQVYTARRLKDQALLAWDVELALKFCSDSRRSIPVPLAYLNDMLRVNQVETAHLDHVDPAFPGIVCAVDYTENLSPALCLIDGSHRAARCRRDGLQFSAYVLTEEESQLCQQSPKARLFRMLQEMQPLRSDLAKVGFDPNCPKCRQRREGPEVFRFERYDRAVFAWDTRLARQLCSDGRGPSLVPPEALDAILGVNQTDPAHLDHVDP